MTPKGWVFYSADFSLQASGKSELGSVTLIRDIEGRKWWHSLSDTEMLEHSLYVYGTGKTIFEALENAATKLLGEVK